MNYGYVNPSFDPSSYAAPYQASLVFSVDGSVDPDVVTSAYMLVGNVNHTFDLTAESVTDPDSLIVAAHNWLLANGYFRITPWCQNSGGDRAGAVEGFLYTSDDGITRSGGGCIALVV